MRDKTAMAASFTADILFCLQILWNENKLSISATV